MNQVRKAIVWVENWIMGMVLAWGKMRGRLMERARACFGEVKKAGMTPQPGIDGILVTVGLCIIALLLCVVMKNSLSEFITSIVSSMTREATNILSGTRV